MTEEESTSSKRTEHSDQVDQKITSISDIFEEGTPEREESNSTTQEEKVKGGMEEEEGSRESHGSMEEEEEREEDTREKEEYSDQIAHADNQKTEEEVSGDELYDSLFYD